MKIQKGIKTINKSRDAYMCSYCHNEMSWDERVCKKCHMTGKDYVVCKDCGKGMKVNSIICDWCTEKNKGENVYISFDPRNKGLGTKYYYFHLYIGVPLSIIDIFLSIEYRTIIPNTLNIIMYLTFAYGLYKKTSWSWKLMIFTTVLNNIIVHFTSNTYSNHTLLLGSILFIYINFKYFKRRSHIFK